MTGKSWAKFENSNGGPSATYADDSERFADWAVSQIVHAGRFGEGTPEYAASMRAAHTYATLALRDKVDELTSVLREGLAESASATRENTATLNQVIELRRRAA